VRIASKNFKSPGEKDLYLGGRRILKVKKGPFALQIKTLAAGDPPGFGRRAFPDQEAGENNLECPSFQNGAGGRKTHNRRLIL